MTKSATTAGSPEQFTTDATTYFKAIPEAAGRGKTSTPNPTIVVTGSATQKTMFLNLPGIGIPQADVSVTATTS